MHQDIFFVKRNGSATYRDVFITKSFTKAATPTGTPAVTGSGLPYDAALFSLGMILIELILVKPFHDLVGQYLIS